MMNKSFEDLGIKNTFTSVGDDLMEIYADAEFHAPVLAEGYPYVLQYEIKKAKMSDIFTIEKPSAYVIRVIIFEDESGKRLWMEDHYVKEEEKFHMNKVDKDSLFYGDYKARIKYFRNKR